MNNPQATESITWHGLQERLRKCSTEAEVQALIDAERGTDSVPGPNRLRWLMRMQGRLRVLRTKRENEELISSTEGK